MKKKDCEQWEYANTDSENPPPKHYAINKRNIKNLSLGSNFS